MYRLRSDDLWGKSLIDWNMLNIRSQETDWTCGTWTIPIRLGMWALHDYCIAFLCFGTGTLHEVMCWAEMHAFISVLKCAAQHTDLNQNGLAHQRWHKQNWVFNKLFMNIGCGTRTFRTYWSVCNMNFERIQQSFGRLTLSNTLWSRCAKSRLGDVIYKAARPH